MAQTNLSLCFLSPIGGVIHRLTHRYKTLLVIGAIAKVIGDGILIEDGTRSTGQTAKLIASRIVLGFGGWCVIGTSVASQASVPHQDLSTVIAVISLASTIASSIGTTIAASIWQSRMVGFMQEEVPDDTPEETIQYIYGSITNLKTEYEYDDPIRQGAIRAYKRTNGILFATSCAISGAALLICFVMPSKYTTQDLSYSHFRIFPQMLTYSQITIWASSKMWSHRRAWMVRRWMSQLSEITETEMLAGGRRSSMPTTAKAELHLFSKRGWEWRRKI